MGYFMILAAIPGFFVSSAILMGMWTVLSPHFGIANISYQTAMLITITAWLTVAPLAAVGRRKRK